VHEYAAATCWPIVYVAPFAGDEIVTVGAVVSGAVWAMAEHGNAAAPSTTATATFHGLIMNTLCKIEELPRDPAPTLAKADPTVNLRPSKRTEVLLGAGRNTSTSARLRNHSTAE
jgi:hypothetical protein